MENLPKEIYFEEKQGSNGIKCLDYENKSNVKYIREDIVNDKLKKMKCDLLLYFYELLKK